MNEETKDTRIAELERQATMDGGLARLALNAAKDQLASAEAALDKAQALNVELRAQLQAAPAERGVDAYAVAERVRTALDKQACPNAWMVVAYEAVVSSLNPAPATADSDVREVK